ncbi:putative permease [Xenococcus sp. PCC 7305]|uniref:AI-2E family transporter n=1 Tax=Xenococcus sp. PCC 7305 TaxID=102125 RepID=UPI0002ACA0A9|nr:AI-2E family transporter [Xenococcus sp. PCC 7305]ELS00518.1 putative permease [Xenococcus sp. PCC 7305]
MENNLKSIDLVIRIFVLGLVAAWCFILVRPFIALVLWASILAIALFPLFLWLKSLLGGRAKLSATLITLIGIAIIIGPVSFIATVLVSNIQTLAENVSAGTLVVPPPPEGVATWPFIGESVNNIWQEAAVNLGAVLDKFGPQIKGITKSLLLLSANTGLTILKFIASLIISALLMLNAEGITRGLTRFMTRLSPNQGQAFLQLAAATVRNVTRGVLGIAILQNLLIGIGLTVGGIPAAGLLSLLCLFLTVIQIGPGLIVIATLFFAWSNMSTLSAILFTLWMIPAMLVDNVLKPILMASGLSVPMLVILIGVLGGTFAHGIVGLFIGPVTLSVGYELINSWINSDSSVA